MTAKYDSAEVVRLIVRARKRYAATGVVGTVDALDLADQLEATRVEIDRLTEVAERDRQMRSGACAAVVLAQEWIAERDAKIDVLTVARNADRTEWMTTYEAMRAENARLTEDLSHATCADGDHLSKASRRMCETVMGDRDALRAKVRELETLVEQLRCYDLDSFFAGELAPDRANGFRVHLVGCAACQSGLTDLMQVKTIASAPPRQPRGPR